MSARKFGALILGFPLLVVIMMATPGYAWSTYDGPSSYQVPYYTEVHGPYYGRYYRPYYHRYYRPRFRRYYRPYYYPYYRRYYWPYYAPYSYYNPYAGYYYPYAYPNPFLFVPGFSFYFHIR